LTPRDAILVAIRSALAEPGGESDLDEAILDAIGDAGFAVADRDELETWKRTLLESNERNKAVARAAIKAAGCRALLLDVERDEESARVRVIVCDPDGDEEATLSRIVTLFGLTAGPEDVRQVPGPAPKGGAS
jgi:hypothetical protein